jgi:hypothetical protein
MANDNEFEPDWEDINELDPEIIERMPINRGMTDMYIHENRRRMRKHKRSPSPWDDTPKKKKKKKKRISRIELVRLAALQNNQQNNNNNNNNQQYREEDDEGRQWVYSPTPYFGLPPQRPRLEADDFGPNPDVLTIHGFDYVADDLTNFSAVPWRSYLNNDGITVNVKPYIWETLMKKVSDILHSYLNVPIEENKELIDTICSLFINKLYQYHIDENWILDQIINIDILTVIDLYMEITKDVEYEVSKGNPNPFK